MIINSSTSTKSSDNAKFKLTLADHNCFHKIVLGIPLKSIILQKEVVSLAHKTTVLGIPHNISYSDSSTGETCGLSTIPVPCAGRKFVAMHLKYHLLHACLNMSVSFFASSSLGNGPASGRTLISLQQYNNSESRYLNLTFL